MKQSPEIRSFCQGEPNMEVTKYRFLFYLLFVVAGVAAEVIYMEKDEEFADTFAFASYYQSNMILQREPHQAIIWGYGTIGATVNITVNVQSVHSTKVKPGFDGRGVWMVKIKPQPAFTKTDIQGVHDNSGMLHWILIRDVMFGDVWVCSGQSNMQFTMSMAFNATEELKETVNYPDLRIFTLAENYTVTPQYDIIQIQQNWSIPSKETVGGAAWTYFSAVCWLYGRYLYDELKVPIGLIATTWGGTPVESWSSPAVLAKCGVTNENWPDPSLIDVINGPHDDSVLWNAMIHPILNMTIKGAIWYQGEANTNYNRDAYQCMFPSMIDSWREEWYIGSQSTTDKLFPFGFVQLSTQVNGSAGFPIIRWHQTGDHGYVPNDDMPKTFMAVAMDLPDASSPYGSIHPRDKQDVSRRMANAALSVAYRESTVFDGPFPEKITETTEKEILIEYSVYQQLLVSDEKDSFQICCKSSACDIKDPEDSPLWATTPIVSHSDHTITLSGKKCNDAFEFVKKVRYAWAVIPCEFKKCQVYNTLGNPAPPFIRDVESK